MDVKPKLPGFSSGSESLAIVFHTKPRPLRIEKQFDLHFVCLRMFHDVRQSFLTDSQQTFLYLQREPADHSIKRKAEHVAPLPAVRSLTKYSMALFKIHLLQFFWVQIPQCAPHFRHALRGPTAARDAHVLCAAGFLPSESPAHSKCMMAPVCAWHTVSWSSRAIRLRSSCTASCMSFSADSF